MYLDDNIFELLKDKADNLKQLIENYRNMIKIQQEQKDKKFITI